MYIYGDVEVQDSTPHTSVTLCAATGEESKEEWLNNQGLTATPFEFRIQTCLIQR